MLERGDFFCSLKEAQVVIEKWRVLYNLRLHLCPHLRERQRHTHQQLLPSDGFELVIGLAVFPLVFVSHGGSPL
jgi:hypothetical protein